MNDSRLDYGTVYWVDRHEAKKLKSFKGKTHHSGFSKMKEREEKKVTEDAVLFRSVPDLWSQKDTSTPCVNPGARIIVIDQYNFWVSQQLLHRTDLAFINRYIDFKLPFK